MAWLLIPALAVGWLSTCVGDEPPITALAFAPGGNQMIAGSQAGLVVHDWPDLNPIRRLQLEIKHIHTVKFSPDETLLAVTGGAPAEVGVAIILRWPTGETVRRIEAHDDLVMDAAWLDAQTLVLASMDRRLSIHDVSAARQLGALEGHARGVTAVESLTESGLIVSSGIDQSLRVWDIRNREVVRNMSIHTLPVHDLASQQAESGLPTVVSASADRTLRIWQPSIGRMVRFASLNATPLVVTFSRDRQWLIAGCDDGSVNWVDPVNVDRVIQKPAIAGWIYALAIHPDDGTVVVGGTGGVIRRVKPPTTEPPSPGIKQFP